MLKHKPILLSAIGVLVLALIAIGIAVALNREESNPARLLELGEKYLLELNYEQAIIAFNRVIEIEPMNARAYAGAAEAYAALGQTKLAMEALRRGYDASGDVALLTRLDALQAQMVAAMATPPPTPTQWATSEPSIEPIAPPEPINTNITGEAPFTFKDLDNWGFPWGITARELNIKGLLFNNSPEIGVSSLINDAERGDEESAQTLAHYYYGDYTTCYYYINDYNLRISRVIIPGDSAAVGPRGIALGMTLEEAMFLFQCDYADALAFARAPSPVDVDHFILYQNYTDEEHEYGSAAISIIKRDEGDLMVLQYGCYMPLVNDMSRLHISFENNIATVIEVFYDYQERVE